MSYQNAIVTFMDILGFARMVEDSMPAGNINRILDKVEEELLEEEQGAIPVGTKTICVSDCAIRVHPLGNRQAIPLQILGPEAYILGIIQVRLLAEGLPVRGGMTSGNVHISENRFFGPAYQEAYKLERKACYPRIVVDEKLLKDLYDELLQYEPEEPQETLQELNGVISRDDDNVWFVDYLRIHSDACEHHCEAVEFLIRHHELISERLQTFAGHPEVLPKYWWMRRYHNRYVKEVREDLLEEMGLTPQQLKISED